jgi:signal transduction histidine kinase
MVASVWLLARGEATPHTQGSAFMFAIVSVCALAVTLVPRAALQLPASRLAVALLLVLTEGLSRSGDAALAVAGHAAAACAPLVCLLSVRSSRRHRWFFTAVAFGTAATVATRVWYRQPIAERVCLPACVENPFLIRHLPAIVTATERSLAVAVVAFAIGAVAHARRRELDSETAAEALLLVLAVLLAVRLAVRPVPTVDASIDRWSDAVVLTTLVVVMALRSRVVQQTIQLRRSARRFASALASGSDLHTVAAHLRAVAGDPTLTLHPGPASWPDNADRIATAIEHEQAVVATVRHAPRSTARVAAAITPAIRISLATEWLRKEAEQDLRLLRVSSAEAVAATDDARRVLERDLHDGAQQQLLVVGMMLSDQGGTVRDHTRPLAAELVRDALHDLRRVGRGDAAAIAELGLEAALTAAAGSANVAVTIRVDRCGDETHDCWPEAIATTAYRLAMSAMADAPRCGATVASIAARCEGAEHGRTVITSHDGSGVPDRGVDLDRIATVGGRVVLDRRNHGSILEARLP